MAPIVVLHEIAPERYWSCVDIAGEKECWPWAASVSRKGYGLFYERGRTIGAHRVSWSLRSGRDPVTPEVVRHTCDNPPCCNPLHLAIGTQADNNRDVAARRWHLPYPGLDVARLLADGGTEEDLIKVFRMHPDTAERYVRLGAERVLLRAYRPRATRPPGVDRRRNYDLEQATALAQRGAAVHELMTLGMSRATAYRLLQRIRHSQNG